MKLYHSQKSRSLRALWILEELALEYELVTFPFRGILLGKHKTPEFLQKSPLGLLPVLEDQGITIYESGAICSWLADRFPEKKLAPKLDDPLRPLWLQWMFFSNATLEPHAFTMVRHTRILPKKYRSEQRVASARKQLQACLSLLEPIFAQHPFILSTGFSAADIMLATTLQWVNEELADFPKCAQYLQQIDQRPALIKANQIK